MDRLKWPGINETTAEPRGPALTRLKPQVLCYAFRVVQGTQRPRTRLGERKKERGGGSREGGSVEGRKKIEDVEGREREGWWWATGGTIIYLG